MAVLDLMRKHTRNNETPLYALATMTAPVKVQNHTGPLLGTYGLSGYRTSEGAGGFLRRPRQLELANLDSMGNQTYQVKAARQPQYGGANIIPLKGTGNVSVQIKGLVNGHLPHARFGGASTRGSSAVGVWQCEWSIVGVAACGAATSSKVVLAAAAAAARDRRR